MAELTDFYTPDESAFIQQISPRFPEKNIVQNLQALIALSPADRPKDAWERLKKTLRSGWIRTGTPITECETVSQHTDEMISMAKNDMGLSGDTLSVFLVPMVEDHDLAEGYVGDFTPLDSITTPDKHYLELLTMKCIYESNPHRLSLWIEGEEGKSKPARWKNEIDKLQMYLEAKRKLDRFPERQQHIDHVHKYFLVNEGSITDQGRALYHRIKDNAYSK